MAVLRKKVPYLGMRCPEHPLAGKRGFAPIHRVVLYDAIGPGPHPCFRCERPLNWYARLPSRRRPPDYLVVHHFDGWSLNNSLDNLRPSCGPCNNSEGAKNQEQWAKLRCFELPRKPLKSRYKKLRRVGHPLATKDGHLAEHRLILYEKIGPWAHECNWCQRMLRWTPGKMEEDSILPDHINWNTHDNSPDNIVPSCPKCNALHRQRYNLNPGEFMAEYPSGMRYRATWKNCEGCGALFAKKVSERGRDKGRFCSKSCSSRATNISKVVLGPGEFLLPINSGGKNLKVKMANCACCGKPFPRPTFSRPGENMNCSNKCGSTTSHVTRARHQIEALNTDFPLERPASTAESLLSLSLLEARQEPLAAERQYALTPVGS